MDRHFGLPLAFAAAAHAALLFAFERPVRRVTEPTTITSIREFVLYPPEPELVVVEPDAGMRETVTPPRPQPSRPEPLAIDPGAAFVIAPPPIRAVAEGEFTTIELGALVTEGRTGEHWAPHGIISKDFLDNSPRTRFQAAPIYPFDAKKDGRPGEVVVEFIVDEQGRVLEPHVMSSTDRMFEEPTLRAVAKWVFEPGRRNGQVVRFKMAVPVVFTLND